MWICIASNHLVDSHVDRQMYAFFSQENYQMIIIFIEIRDFFESENYENVLFEFINRDFSKTTILLFLYPKTILPPPTPAACIHKINNIMGEAELTRFFPKHQQLPLLVPLMDHRQKVCIYILFRSIIFFHHGHGCFYMSNWLVRLDRFRVRLFVGVTDGRTYGRTKFLLHPL